MSFCKQQTRLFTRRSKLELAAGGEGDGATDTSEICAWGERGASVDETRVSEESPLCPDHWESSQFTSQPTKKPDVSKFAVGFKSKLMNRSDGIRYITDSLLNSSKSLS